MRRFLPLAIALSLALACGDDSSPPTEDGGTGTDALTPDAGPGEDTGGGGEDSGCPDMDGDGVCDDVDECVNGDDALDADTDGVADACDQCPDGDDGEDADADGVPDACDCDAATCTENASCEETAMALTTCVCDEGFTGDGTTCEAFDCGALTAPTDGMLAADTTTFGSVATYTCNAGFTLVGAAERTCLADGWSDDDPICTSVDCGSLDAPANGSIDLPSTGFSAVATYTCDEGHLLAGDTTRTCQMSGMWDGAEPTCTLVDCGALDAPLEGMVDTDRDTLGGTATYTCNAGYMAMGPTSRTCRSDETWSGRAPTCAPVDCGALPAPANGAVDAMFTTFGSIASYFCDAGYELVGPGTRTCGEEGLWTGTEDFINA